jgi:putative CocE/NonD family hydrolase
MKPPTLRALAALAAFALPTGLTAQAQPRRTTQDAPPAAAVAPDLAQGPSDIATDFADPLGGFNYERTKVMIPMRDGVKLLTVIVRPKTAGGRMPMVLTRTPYDADEGTARVASPDAAMILATDDELLVRNGYIRVYQDVRGIHGSEGRYLMNLPPRGPMNSGKVDHGTDTWDTIEWLVKNVPDSNGKVGITGVSYDGFLTLMGLLDPHPALAAAAPMNAMVEGWIGDDWYHNGAFRQTMIEYIYAQTTEKSADRDLPYGYHDLYEAFLDAGSAAAVGRRYGVDRLPAWRRLIENPAYTDFWRLQAVDKMLAAAPRTVPTLHVHGLFDQEDIYGPVLAYAALEEKDRANDRNRLVIGPWHHGQQTRDAEALGPFRWGSDTGLYFREQVLQPFWDQHLKGVAPPEPPAPVLAFETGANRWRRYESWPPAGVERRKLHLQPGGALAFAPPSSPAQPAWSDYESDPAKPVPYRQPPIRATWTEGSTWRQWLVDDQRPAASRPDVLVFRTEPLAEPLAISGEVVANLFASITGSDVDWVVKLIDVHPPEVRAHPELGGYQLMVSADIFRGRYYDGFETAKPVPPGEMVEYRFRLPHANHTFLPGHRVMVQVQSSWFPLYDRNPQTFVENIAFAEAKDYRVATHRVHHGAEAASFIELPVRTSR